MYRESQYTQLKLFSFCFSVYSFIRPLMNDKEITTPGGNLINLLLELVNTSFAFFHLKFTFIVLIALLKSQLAILERLATILSVISSIHLVGSLFLRS